MPYCPKCGVELDAGASVCPLCGTPIALTKEETAALKQKKNGFPSTEDQILKSPPDCRGARSVELLSVLFGIAALLTTCIDLFFAGGHFTWSPLVLTCLAGVWLAADMPVILKGRPWILCAVLVPGELALLFLIDVFDGNPAWWFFNQGLPIYLLSVGIAVALLVLISITKRRDINILGYFLAAASLECVGIEFIMSLALWGRIQLRWSPIVAIVCVPLAGFLVYLHYRVVKKPLARKFHT